MVDLYIFIDALGWEYIKEVPFFEEVLKHKQKVKSILGYSSAAIPSIISGELPEETDHWNFFYYNKKTPFKKISFLKLIPEFIQNNKIFRRFGKKYINKLAKKISGYTGYFQLYDLPYNYFNKIDYCEKKDIFREGLNNSKTIFDEWKEKGIKYKVYSYPSSEKEIMKRYAKDIKNKEIERFFLCLQEFDSFMHNNCKNRKNVVKLIKRYEQKVKQIYNEAKKYHKEVNISVFSDHGMTPVTKEIDLMKQIKKLKLKNKDFLPLYDSTMARFYFFNKKSEIKVTKLLNKIKYGRVLTQKEKEHYGINFKNNKYGDLIYLLNPGIIINPSHMGRSRMNGMHGYDPDKDKYMDATFMSNKKKEIKKICDVMKT